MRGGTATAIALSERCSVPVFNLRNEASLKRLVEYLAALPSPVLIGSTEPQAPRFVHGNWEHIFPGQHSAAQIRFAFDRDIGHVTAMQVHNNSGWTSAARNDIGDLEDMVTADSRERHFGRVPLVEGTSLSLSYADEMQGELTDDQAVRVVAYLRGMTEEDAKADLMDRIKEGAVHFRILVGLSPSWCVESYPRSSRPPSNLGR